VVRAGRRGRSSGWLQALLQALFFKHFLFASPKKKIVKQIFLETASEFKFFGTLAFLGKRKFL
jgi:hypothetical protein